MAADDSIGAHTTADGITARPDYAFAPPAEFFAAAAPLSGAGIYNIMDYGAVASATFDNRSALQAAIEAAHDGGGGIVYVPSGIYGIAAGTKSNGSPDPSAGGVQLLDNVFIKGDGMGSSSLRVIDGVNQAITGIVRTSSNGTTSNFGIADLTLDGNRANNTAGKTDGFYCGTAPGAAASASDGYLLRIEATDCRGYGFDPHEQTTRLTIKDCVAHGNGLDGFALDNQVDAEIIGNVSFGNDRSGFNLCTTTTDTLLVDNVAYDNGGAGIVVQRGNENIPGSHNIVIQGGASYGNSSDGIRLQLVNDVVVNDVDIYDNGRNGVRIEGSSHVTVEGNRIADNGRSGTVVTNASGLVTTNVAEIYILQDDDTGGASGVIVPASYNLVARNVIAEAESPASPYGVREFAGNANFNYVIDNTIIGTATTAVVLAGSQSSLTVHAGDGGEVVNGGSGADFLYGGKGADSLYGGSGADLLSGGGASEGNDLLRGGTGDDVYIVESAATTVVEGQNAGSDVVRTSLATFTLSGSVEMLVFTGTGNFAGTGNSSDNVIIGAAGDDLIRGNAGDDLLIGLAGTNTLIGGSGDDTYFLTGGADTVIETVGNGFDVVATNLAGITTIMANVEELVLYGHAAGAVGSKGDDILIASEALGGVKLDGGAGSDVLYGSQHDDEINGGDGDDFLTGLGGSNALAGGAGNDIYVINSASDTIIEEAVGGFDIVFAAHAGTVTIGANVEELVLVGSADGAIGSAGNDILAAMQTTSGVRLDGGDGNDVLYGGTHDDQLFGGSGDDVLFDGGGSDFLAGDVGDDTYYLAGASTVVEDDNGGLDVVFTSAAGTTTIMAGVEKLALMGAATGGIGDMRDNIIGAGATAGGVMIDGGAGNDILFGGGHDDLIMGGSGDDLIWGGGGSDRFDFRNAGSGHDFIGDFDLASDVIDLSGRGFDAASLGSAIALADDADGDALVTVGLDAIKLAGLHASDLTVAHFIL